ncbi:MAG TPA: type III secretion system outer membrane ring subunit SctC [Pararobbsia sp.]|nr:type III secretion system outer membrane ring subunit SctC [Pararobbsia sp.]
MSGLRALGTATLCASLTFGTVRTADAATVHWKSLILDYEAQGKDIKDVLRDFAASQGIPTRISQDVSGTVSGKFHLPPRRFLDTLAASFGFVWYYDGEVLDITSAADMQSALVKLDSADTESLRSELDRLHIADDRFPIVYDSAQGTALVSGPQRYVDMIKAVTARLDDNAAHRPGTQVRVFPLEHAWAQDRTVSIDGEQVTLQGVATVLSGIYHPEQAKRAPTRGSGRTSSNVTRSSPTGDVNGSTYNNPFVPPPFPDAAARNGLLAGTTGEPSPAIAAAIGDSQASQEQMNAAPAGSPAGDDPLPVIVADQRTNSVVIRDTGDRMEQYDALIRRLDVKPQLVEIEAHVIEVDVDAMRQLGVDWTASNSHLNVQTGTGTLGQLTYNGSITQNFGQTTLPGSTLAAATPAGASVAAVLGDAGRYLMARISAMQENSTAKIDASPKVVTLNNVEAVMDDETQFFVPVQGYTSGNLYSISTGMSLRVLPMVVEEDGHTRIKLDVEIQDGELTSQTVSNLPVVQNSTINTQAFIDEGQALLIAGYRTNNTSKGTTGVPGLSKIPLIGALFRTDTSQKSRMERMFLLTPHVIAPE